MRGYAADHVHRFYMAVSTFTPQLHSIFYLYRVLAVGSTCNAELVIVITLSPFEFGAIRS
jgi:hypothetical protein